MCIGDRSQARARSYSIIAGRRLVNSEARTKYPLHSPMRLHESLTIVITRAAIRWRLPALLDFSRRFRQEYKSKYID